MKCNKCGHLNKDGMYYCVKCGSSLDQSSPIRKYKQSTLANPKQDNILTKTQKFIIALVIIGILIVVLSAVAPPDLQMPSLNAPGNDTQVTPSVIEDKIADKLNTTIKVGSVSGKPNEKVTVNAYVTDQNGEPVNSGTVSINLFDVKYSGQVENGNVNIELPKLSENNYETTMVYEGNDKYNPSETKVSIEVNKLNTKFEASKLDNEVLVTLKTGSNETISGAKIIILDENNTQTEQQTDDKGQIRIKFDQPGKHELKLTYPGDEVYNPTETTITAGKDKIETKLDTKYNEQDKTITITLMTKDNTPVVDAELTIVDNGETSVQKTDNQGQAKISVIEGENKITIKYDGNDTYNSSETTVNTVLESVDNDTVNNTNNETNDTMKENITGNDTVNNTNNTTEQSKINTTFRIEMQDNQTIATLLTSDGKELSGQFIKIIYDNGTQVTEKTDNNGRILLNMTNETVKEIELVYDGNEEYNSFKEIIR